MNYRESEGSFMSQKGKGGRGRGKRNYMESNYVARGSVTDHHCTSQLSFLLSFPPFFPIPPFLLPLPSHLPPVPLFSLHTLRPSSPPLPSSLPLLFPATAAPSRLMSGYLPLLRSCMRKGSVTGTGRHCTVSFATRPRSIWLDKRG